MKLPEMTKEGVVLTAFSDSQQDAIIGWMLEEDHFFISCLMHLEPGYFTSTLNGSIFKTMKIWFDEYNQKPTTEELKSKYHMTNHTDYRKYYDKIDLCCTTTGSHSLKPLSKGMSGWIWVIKLSDSLHKAESLFNRKAWPEAIDYIEKKMAEIRKTSFENDSKVIFNDSVSFFSKRTESFSDCLTIGNPEFDILLREAAKKEDADLTKNDPREWTNGGLVRGDTTIILGPSNSGKTTTLTSIIIPNILAGRRILYMTHEQKWEDIKTKLFQSALNATAEDLTKPSDAMLRGMRVWENKLEDNLVYIPWIKAGDMWVESVIGEIGRQQEFLKSTEGQYFDMIVNDYPGKLKSKEMKGRSGWEEADYVYDQFVNAGMQWRSHMVLPVQTNRDGYKANRGDSSESRVIDQADAAGSFGIMQKADNVITLNRSPQEQKENYMRFYISKSRTQEAQTTFVTKTDFAKSRTHHVRLQSLKVDAMTGNKPAEVLNMARLAFSPEGSVVKRKDTLMPIISQPIHIPDGEMPDLVVNPSTVEKSKKKT